MLKGKKNTENIRLKKCFYFDKKYTNGREIEGMFFCVKAVVLIGEITVIYWTDSSKVVKDQQHAH